MISTLCFCEGHPLLLVRLIIPPVFSTASRLTNSYHFSGNVMFSGASRLTIYTVSQVLRA